MRVRRLSLFIKNFDWLLFVTICLLMILGIILLYSVALGSSSDLNFLNLKKQIVFFIVSLLAFFAVALFWIIVC